MTARGHCRDRRRHEPRIFDIILQMPAIKRALRPDDLNGRSFLAAEDPQLITRQTLAVDRGLVRS